MALSPACAGPLLAATLSYGARTFLPPIRKTAIIDLVSFCRGRPSNLLSHLKFNKKATLVQLKFFENNADKFTESKNIFTHSKEYERSEKNC